jgi:hypothetical protein
MQTARNEEQDRQIAARDRQIQHLLAEAQELLSKRDAIRIAPPDSRSERNSRRKRTESAKSNDRY